MIVNRLRTGAWFGDTPLRLDFPDDWEVEVRWPETPPPLSASEIEAAVERPTGQETIRNLCRGKLRPVVIVDDLNRPTPCSAVLPYVLGQLRDAGILAENVTVLVASGAHAPPVDRAAIHRKIGSAAERCKLVVHDPDRDLRHIGKTSLGTPVFVNRCVVESDFVMGIGGIYPNHTAGMGGGTKLVLGILGLKSIRHLHYGHAGLGWAKIARSAFRDDLNEIAAMLGFQTCISLQVNADREVIRVDCGDPSQCFANGSRFATEVFGADPPDDADVVIANTYPNDLSVLFARMKGFGPFRYCAPTATRVAIACCPEGLGHHQLFPLVRTKLHRYREFARRASVRGIGYVTTRVSKRLQNKLLRVRKADSGPRDGAHSKSRASRRVWVYRPGTEFVSIPSEIAGMHIRGSWNSIIDAVREEQGRRRLKVVIYPCSPLQWIR